MKQNHLYVIIVNTTSVQIKESSFYVPNYLSKQMQQSKSNERYKLLDIFSLKCSFFMRLYDYYSSKDQE